MSALTNAAETALLRLLLENVDWTGIGDAGGLRGSATAGSFYISLHTADPGEAGSQTTNEVAYTSYARVAVVRSGSGWTVAGDNGSNVGAVTFPACTGGSATATHFGLGTSSSGAGQLILRGALTASLAISSGVTPSMPIGDLDITAA